MRLRHLSLMTAFIILFSTASFAAANDAGTTGVVTAGGLVCFDIARPNAPSNPSCDRLCAARGAVCTSIKTDGAMNPGFGCADALDRMKGGDTVASCRCCAIKP